MPTNKHKGRRRGRDQVGNAVAAIRRYDVIQEYERNRKLAPGYTPPPEEMFKHYKLNDLNQLMTNVEGGKWVRECSKSRPGILPSLTPSMSLLLYRSLF